LALRNSVLIMI